MRSNSAATASRITGRVVAEPRTVTVPGTKPVTSSSCSRVAMLARSTPRTSRTFFQSIFRPPETTTKT